VKKTEAQPLVDRDALAPVVKLSIMVLLVVFVSIYLADAVLAADYLFVQPQVQGVTFFIADGAKVSRSFLWRFRVIMHPPSH